MLAVAFGIGCGFCFFDAAAWGAQLRLVGKARIATTNSVIWSTEVILGIGAPAAAGLLAAMTDPTVVLAADAVTYLASAALIAQVRNGLDLPLARTASRRLRADIGEGLAYIWRQPVIRTLCLTGFGFNVACGGALSLLVVHADQVLGLTPPDRRIGLLYTASAIGSLIAAVALPRLSRYTGQGPVSIIGYAVFIAPTLGLIVNPFFGGGLLLWATWTFSELTVNGNGITVRQILTPDELQGRVNTTGRMIAWGGTPFGALLGGWVTQAAGIRLAYLILAAPAVIGLAILLATPVRRLRIPAT